MEGLVPGRIVYYVFSEATAEEVNRRRTTALSISERIKVLAWPLGAQAHIGNHVNAGDICPAMVTKVWTDGGNCNLRVTLDGSDDYWTTSVFFDAFKGGHTWHWMFNGQDKRYTPDNVSKGGH